MKTIGTNSLHDSSEFQYFVPPGVKTNLNYNKPVSNYTTSGTNPHQSYQSFNTQPNVSTSSNQNTSIDSTSYRGQQLPMPSFLANQKNSNIGAKLPSNMQSQTQAPNQIPIVPPPNIQNRPNNMATYLNRPGQSNIANSNTASWRKN